MNGKMSGIKQKSKRKKTDGGKVPSGFKNESSLAKVWTDFLKGETDDGI